MEYGTGHGGDVQTIPRAINRLGDERAAVLVADTNTVKVVLAEGARLDDQFVCLIGVRINDRYCHGVLAKLRDERGYSLRQAGAAALAVVVAYLTELQAAVADMHGCPEGELEESLDTHRGELLPGMDGVDMHVDVDIALVESADIIPIGWIGNR